MSSTGTSPRAHLIEELRDFCEQVENSKEDAEELTAPLTEQQFNWRPGPGQWSISECLTHLISIDRRSVEVLSREIEQARQAGLLASGPFRYGFFSRKFVSNVEPPSRFRVKAPKEYAPAPGHPKDKVVPEFHSTCDRVIELIHAANGLDLARIKGPVPFSRFVKFSLGMQFALLTAHDRRHLWQAWQVRKNANFPV
jgi:DinB family protein